MRKLIECAEMGIPQIWVVDLVNRFFQRYVGRRLIQERRFMMPERSIDFDLAEVAGLLRP